MFRHILQTTPVDGKFQNHWSNQLKFNINMKIRLFPNAAAQIYYYTRKNVILASIEK